MRKLFFTLLSAVMSLTAFASGEFKLCGIEITKEVMDFGIVDSLNNLANTTVSGTIEYDSIDHVLTLTDVKLESWADTIIALTDSANVTGKVVTIKFVGNDTLETTAPGNRYPKIIATRISYSKSNLRIEGADRKSSLVLDGTNDYALFFPTTVTIQDLQIYVKKGKVGVNGTAGSLTIDNSTLQIDNTTSYALDGLSNLTLTKCALVAPEGAQLISSGVWRPSGNTDPIIIKRYPIVGDTIEVAGVKYEVHNMNPGSEQVYVVKQQDYAGSSLVIPASIEYVGITFQVYMINQDAFRNNENITSVDIACNTILSSAFDKCANLETITLHEGLREIHYGAFNNLPKAKTINIPATVNYIAGEGRSQWYFVSPFGRNSFETITVAEGNKWFKIGEDGALYTMDGKKLIAYPANYSKRIGVIPEGVEEIVYEAFYNTPMADTVVLPTTLEKCPRILASEGAKCVIINSPCNSDFNDTFYYLNNLEEVILGPKCKYLGRKMFYNSGNIRKITVLSDTIPEWGYEAGNSYSPFNGSPLTQAKVYVHCGMGDTFRNNTNKWASFSHIVDTLLYDVKIEVEANKGTAWISQITDCNTIEVSIDRIHSGYTFVKWNNGETTTTATYTITSDTVIRAIVKKNLLIGETFQSDSEEGVPVTYKILSKNKERGEFTVQVGIGNWNSPAILKAYDGVLTIPDSAVYYDEKYAVVEVSQCAFYRCNVADVILPEGLTEIGQDAFAYSHITTMVVPNSVTKMLSEAFYACDSLVSVTLSNNLDLLDMRILSHCDNLTEVTIPESVRYIMGEAFSYCPNLATINWNPDNILQVGCNPFYGTAWYNNIAEENGGKYVGDILLWVRNNATITSFAIREGTRIIASCSVQNMSNIRDYTIPSTVESIGLYTFNNAPALQRCTINAITPPDIFDGDMKASDPYATAKDLFTNDQYTSLLIYVPKASVTTYQAHEKWNMMNIRPIGGWTVEFKDHNGNNIIDPQQVEQGERPAIIPTEVDTWYSYDYMYVFANAWDTAVVNVGDTIYTARYTQEELPEYKVYFYPTQEEAEAATTAGLGFAKVKHGHAVATEEVEMMIAAVPAKECEQVDEWLGGDITNVTSLLRVYPHWTDGLYDITFFDPIANEVIVVREDIECEQIVVAPDAPVHAGYIFTGWSDDTWQTTKRYTTDLIVNAVYVADPTALEQVNDKCQMSNVKYIKDGQLFIRQGDKIYNAQGARVK